MRYFNCSDYDLPLAGWSLGTQYLKFVCKLRMKCSDIDEITGKHKLNFIALLLSNKHSSH